MPFAQVGLLLGRSLLLLAVAELVPLVVARIYGEANVVGGFAVGILLAAFAGGLLLLTFRGSTRPAHKRDFLLFALAGWLVLAFFAAMPILLSGAVLQFHAAYFEALSGLTTTGASILFDVENAPRGILIWRAMLSALGGLIVIVLALVVAPVFNLGGAALTRNLLPEGEGESIQTRLRGVMRSLAPIYGLLILFCLIALTAAGMPFFDALCHAMGAISTSGFSTRNQSVAAFDSAAIEMVLIPFMLLGALNFTYHWAVLKGRTRHFRHDNEVLGYLTLLGIGILVVFTGSLAYFHAHGEPFGVFESIRVALFSTVSAATTTGYTGGGAAPLSLLGVYTLTALAFAGGVTGSASGGLKIMRVLLMIRHAGRELARLVHPRGVVVVRFNGAVVNDGALIGVWNIYVLFLASLAFLTMAFAAVGADLSTSFFLSLSAITNSGPVISILDPAFAGFPVLGPGARWIYCVGMVLGRLETIVVLVVFSVSFWRN